MVKNSRKGTLFCYWKLKLSDFSRGTEMKIIILGLVFLFGIFSQKYSYSQVGGTKNLTLSNSSYSCINAKKQLVDFWILSARAPKQNSFWTDTKGIGVRVDVQLASADGGSHFPAAASINATEINSDIVRTALSLHILDQMDLWSTSPGNVTKTTSFGVPVNFVRRKGSSDTVKVMQALISFTNTAAAGIPANPYAKGAQLFGQFFNNLNTVFAPNPSEIFDPDFQLSFGIGRVDTGCQDVQLKQGVGVQIKDYEAGTEESGFIRTSQAENYCFYKLNNDKDPDIGFKKKNGACSAAIPADVIVLQNPQFVWMAFGTCKDDVDCGVVPALTANSINPLSKNLASFGAAFSLRSDSLTTDLGERLQAVIQNKDFNSLKKFGPKTNKIVHGLALCESVGISSTRCFDKKVAIPIIDN